MDRWLNQHYLPQTNHWLSPIDDQQEMCIIFTCHRLHSGWPNSWGTNQYWNRKGKTSGAPLHVSTTGHLWGRSFLTLSYTHSVQGWELSGTHTDVWPQDLELEPVLHRNWLSNYCLLHDEEQEWGRPYGHQQRQTGWRRGDHIHKVVEISILNSIPRLIIRTLNPWVDDLHFSDIIWQIGVGYYLTMKCLTDFQVNWRRMSGKGTELTLAILDAECLDEGPGTRHFYCSRERFAGVFINDGLCRKLTLKPVPAYLPRRE